MKLENMQKVLNINAVITSSNSNIENLEKLKAQKEIMIISTHGKVYEAVKKLMSEMDFRYSEDDQAPMYYSGKIKDGMLNVAIKNNEEFRDKQLDQLQYL